MKRLSIAFLLSVLFAVPFAGAFGHTLQNTRVTMNLHDVSCSTNQVCYAVGTGITSSGNVMIKTTDGGQTWTRLRSEVSYALFGVHAVDVNTVFVVGASNRVLKTTDGGVSWRSVLSDGESTTMWDVDCDSTGNTCLSVGFIEQILRTTDGGASWTRVRGATAFTVTSDTANLDRVAFASGTRAFAVGGAGKILRSEDAGATWEEVSRGLAATYFSVDCLDENTCFAGGGVGEFVRTTDGGNTWTVVTRLEPTVSIRGLHFTDSMNGWANGGALWRTSDGGVTWEWLERFSGLSILRGSSFVGTEGWISGNEGRMIKIGSATSAGDLPPSQETADESPQGTFVPPQQESQIRVPSHPTLASRSREKNAAKRKRRMELQKKLKEMKQALREGRLTELKTMKEQFKKQQETLKEEKKTEQVEFKTKREEMKQNFKEKRQEFREEMKSKKKEERRPEFEEEIQEVRKEDVKKEERQDLKEEFRKKREELKAKREKLKEKTHELNEKKIEMKIDEGKPEPEKETKKEAEGKAFLEITRMSEGAGAGCAIRTTASRNPVAYSRYRLRAFGEDMILNRLTVINDLSGAFDSPAEAMALYGVPLSTSTQNWSLALVGGSGTFSGLGIVVPVGTDVYLNLNADVIGLEPEVNGLTFRLGIRETENSPDTLQAIGRASALTYSADNIVIDNGDPGTCSVRTME